MNKDINPQAKMETGVKAVTASENEQTPQAAISSVAATKKLSWIRRAGINAKEVIRKITFSYIKKEKIFEGIYIDTELAIRKWKADTGAMIIHVEIDGQVLKHDFNLRNTAARKIGRKTVWYYHQNAITDWLGYTMTKWDLRYSLPDPALKIFKQFS